jgi:hypothetical protein
MKEEKKYYKGEKYIYLLMAFKLCLNNMENETMSKSIQIGDDNGFIGGQNYYRRFRIMLHDNKWLLTETKIHRSFADFSRTFEIDVKNLAEPLQDKKPLISDYIDEYNDNCGKNWKH